MTRRAPGTLAAQESAAADLARDGEDVDTILDALARVWPREPRPHLARVAQRALNTCRVAA